MLPSIILIKFKCLLNIRVKATTSHHVLQTTDQVVITLTITQVITGIIKEELIRKDSLITTTIRDMTIMASMIDMRRFLRREDRNQSVNPTSLTMKTKMTSMLNNNSVRSNSDSFNKNSTMQRRTFLCSR